MKGRGKCNDDGMVWDMRIQGQGDMGLHSRLLAGTTGQLDSYLPHALAHCIFHRFKGCIHCRNVPIYDRDHIGSPNNDVPHVLGLSANRWDRCIEGS